MTTSPKTFKDAEALAAEQGIILSANDRRKIAETQAAERARLQALQGEAAAPDLATRFNTYYPKLLQFILSIGETILTFSQTLIVSLGIPLVLVLLLIVEHQRVVHGIALFEADYALASFAAGALVLLNLVLEFQIHHVEQKAGYHQERAAKWSLRIWAVNALYTIGYGDAWQAQYQSPAVREKKTLRLVTFAILALALLGSMRTVIEGIEGTWHEGLIAIVTESTLAELMTWLGGLLFALAAVVSAQVLSRYVAIRCVEIISAMKARAEAAADPLAEAIDEAGANAILGIIAKAQEARAQKATGRAPDAVSIDAPAPAALPQDATIQPTEEDTAVTLPLAPRTPRTRRNPAPLPEPVPEVEISSAFLAPTLHSGNGTH